jgi:hypothetical protein
MFRERASHRAPRHEARVALPASWSPATALTDSASEDKAERRSVGAAPQDVARARATDVRVFESFNTFSPLSNPAVDRVVDRFDRRVLIRGFPDLITPLGFAAPFSFPAPRLLTAVP